MHTSIHGPQGVQEESRTLDAYAVQGMIVRKFAQRQRTKESLSHEGQELLKFIIELLGKQRVFPNDMLYTELVDGYILEIPRMERSIVFRDTGETCNVVIRTPTHARCVVIDNGNVYRDEIKEVLLWNLEEKVGKHGMMDTVVGTRNKPTQKISIAGHDVPAWIKYELRQLSSMELEMRESKYAHTVAESVSKIREKFTTARKFIGASNVSSLGKDIDIVGGFYGIFDAARIPEDRIMLAAEIYGANEPMVIRAYGIVMAGRLETYRRARNAML